ncbi:hypothetical protein [Candidatus Nitrosocosmicus sp. SS]|uniref:hypothetical protein n=1 Tax=Candidatus Nitrosocosmicus agrestis TaxID=2563600 RepID=UPI00122E7927|nr:hypothetical protein [Candidatus Nitrosocosmicus sp. SS]KAA2279827.1 hypothetical protein F1Z66_12225 [Candidatus Nitrosocosmicus sp. SS]KAF0870355.1 hypothetical protein E5N71_00495 [Candidatus Nitrosocosmicus sp. SS]MDR4491229.1 hypothetical protein [Candidatus Nitrosocosmicus sp.]
MENKNSTNKKIEEFSSALPFVNEKFVELFENFYNQLTELNKISTIGPFISLMNDPQINLNNMREYGNVLINYQIFLNKYLTQMINSYFQALERVSSNIQEKTTEEARKLIINSFEDVFSKMFESAEFSINYNNLINVIIDLNKSYQKFVDASSPLLNRQSLSKEEKDLLFNNLYEIKKLTLEIKNKINERKND